jgi:stage V sporulation protein R
MNLGFYNTNLPAHLRVLKDEIEGYARGYGLDFYETIFEVVDADDLNEIAAYGGFPTRYPHWSFGMQYEELKKGYEYGLSKIYEMVINNDPCYAYLMRCNHTVDQKLVMAHVYGHCLAPETKVETKAGVKPIPDVGVGEPVLTHTGHYRPVTATASRWYEGAIHKLTVGGSNQAVRITAEHPVLLVRGSRCVLSGRENVPCRSNYQSQHKCSGPRPYEGYRADWVPAGEVRPGDWVAFPRRKRVPELAADFVEIVYDKVLHRKRRVGRHVLPVDANLAKFLGYFIAEGNAQARGLIGFGFHREEHEYHREVTQLATSLFGARVGRDDSATSLATTVRFNNLEVARWLREVVGTGADSKRIPDFVFEHADEAVLASCLRGVYNGDGTYTRAVGRESGTLSLSTISEPLAHQLRHACARFGSKTAIYALKRPGRRPSYDLIWSGESAHRLSRLLLGEDALAGDREFERSWSDDDYIYQPVRSVETEPYRGPVYNFSVAEDESYTLAAGFAVHNCDFFKNNAYFGHTTRKMMDEIANHATRIRHFVERYGEDEVEAFMDKCMSIDDLIDIHSVAIRRRDDQSRYDFGPAGNGDAAEEHTPQRVMAEDDEQKKQATRRAAKFPERPEKDVLLFLIEHAPMKNWQRDMLSIIRDEAYYFYPQAQTKILNEGWACLVSGSRVVTDRGLLKIDDVVSARAAVRVSDGTRPQPVYDWAKFEARETVFVRTRRGLELEGSLTHRMMLPGGAWKALGDVAVGDVLKLARGTNLWATEPVRLAWKPEGRLTLEAAAAEAGVSIWTVLRYRDGKSVRKPAAIAAAVERYERQLGTVSYMQNTRAAVRVPEVVDERFGAFLGYLIGDGHVSDKKRVIGLTTGDEAQADHFAALVTELFGITPRKKWDETKWRILFSSRTVQDFLVSLGLKTGSAARVKDVPECILQSPKPVVAAFLRALYDCDGYAGPAGVILATSSTEMSKTVQLLLLNFGVLSTRRPHKDECWHVHTLGQSARTFRDEIGFGLERKQKRLGEYVENRKWFKLEVDDDRVVAVERRRAEVFDVSVEETHRYVAQGLINHNSFWHSTIMTQKVLHPSEVIDYADHHSGTMATSSRRLNPYKLGIELLRDVERRWNMGQFGPEWEGCEDMDKKRTWDKQLGLGRQKIFEVRKIHNDITFIDTFLTPEFCKEYNLFSFNYQDQTKNYVVESREFQKVKQRLLFSLTNFGKPWIYVVDGNHRNRGELLLRHEHHGVDLKVDEARDVLANIQYIWSRPVHLETIGDGHPTVLSFDGTEHTQQVIGGTDDANRKAAPKAK